MADRKAVIKYEELENEDVHKFVLEKANEALENFTDEKDIATYMKREYDVTWHCIVGKSFGAYVSWEAKHYIHFYMGQYAILLWKC